MRTQDEVTALPPQSLKEAILEYSKLSPSTRPSAHWEAFITLRGIVQKEKYFRVIRGHVQTTDFLRDMGRTFVLFEVILMEGNQGLLQPPLGAHTRARFLVGR